MGINIFDAQFFGDLQQFDTEDSIASNTELIFTSRIKESLNFSSRIKETEDVSI